MTKDLLDLVVGYSKGVVSKEYVIQNYNFILLELLEIYLNDKNSSSLRQIITCEVIGIKSNPNKLGYDGDGSLDEVKPKNVSSVGVKTLDGGGNYSDLTLKRHWKYVEDNPTIHISGFVDGFLIYILKIPYTDLESFFYQKLIKKFPNGDTVGNYLRSASFSFNNIKSLPNLEIEFVRENINDYTSFLQKDLYNYLKLYLND
jgi:hypothetical protein